MARLCTRCDVRRGRSRPRERAERTWCLYVSARTAACSEHVASARTRKRDRDCRRSLSRRTRQPRDIEPPLSLSIPPASFCARAGAHSTLHRAPLPPFPQRSLAAARRPPHLETWPTRPRRRSRRTWAPRPSSSSFPSWEAWRPRPLPSPPPPSRRAPCAPLRLRRPARPRRPRRPGSRARTPRAPCAAPIVPHANNADNEPG